MIQFSTTVYIINTKFTSRLCWRFTALFTPSSMMVAPEFSTVASKQNHALPPIAQKEVLEKNFETLKLRVQNSLKSSTAIPAIQQTNNIDELLKLIRVPVLTKNEISTVMQAIVSWVNESSKTIKKDENMYKDSKTKSEVNLQNTKDDCLLKYKDLSTSLMIQEVHNLAKQKKRNPKELKFLLENIEQYNESLSVVQCSILLYSMATLRYVDEKFCEHICKLLIENLNSKSLYTIKSILQSISILRYKNVTFLKHACKLIKDNEQTQPLYVLNIMHSLALLGFISEETNEVIEKYLSLMTIDTLGVDNWLNYVWYLVVLNNMQSSFIESVLCEEFNRTIFSANEEEDILQHVKLLNINAAAKYLLKNYSGPLLKEDINQNKVILYSKEKKEYVDKLQATLSSMSQYKKCFHTNVNTGMGFLLDAECYIDSGNNFVDPNTVKNNTMNKLAIVVNDYSAYCHGSEDLNGIIKLQERLLIHSGYKVLSISYKHFGLEDKIVKLSSFLKSRIKSL